MPHKQVISKTQLTAGCGTVNLSTDEHVDLYVLYTSGAVTLTSGYTIQSSGTDLEGHRYKFHYIADLNFDGNTVTIMGKTMPADLDGINCYIDAYYDGSSWSVKFLPDFESSFITANFLEADSVDTSELATDSVTTAKITDDNVTLAKLENDLLTEIITIPLSFETNEQTTYDVEVPFDCTINEVFYSVTKLIEATDDALIDLSIDGASMTPNRITIPAGSVQTTSATTSITSGNTASAGDNLEFLTSKTTAGGKVICSIKVTRT